jgi:neutral ceramidase
VVPSGAPEDRLFVHALALSDGGDPVVLVFADLHSGGRALWEKVAAEAGFSRERLILAGTHTHQGPGRFYGNPYFDAFTAPGKFPSLKPTNVKPLASVFARAVRDALADLSPSEVCVGTAISQNAGSNRAYRAWVNNGNRKADPGPEDARDRRVTALVVRRGRTVKAVFVLQAVHGTALGPTWPSFSADHVGEMRVRAEAALGAWVAAATGAAGDVSPLAVGRDGAVSNLRPKQGRELAICVGQAHAAALGEAVNASVPVAGKVGVGSLLWCPVEEPGLAPPCPGLATAGGGIDGTSEHFARVGAGVNAPAYRSDRAWPPGHPQHPKVALQHVLAAGKVLPLHALLARLAPRELPLAVLQIGDLVMATVPGEPTTEVGANLESALLGAGAREARVLGFAQDYAGYWTTPKEYDLQLYEGASTLYGRNSSVHLQQRLMQVATAL